MLQREYGYIGYPLYIALLTGAVTGIGAGAISLFNGIKSLSAIIPGVQKQLAIISVVCFVIFTSTATYAVLSSNLILGSSLISILSSLPLPMCCPWGAQ